MNDKRLLAIPTYDDELEKWIIDVNVDGVFMPVGRTIDKKLEIFKICEYESREKAIEWLKNRSDKFTY